MTTTVQPLPLTEGIHCFPSHAAMWEWLASHGFAIEGGGGDDGTRPIYFEPDGWEWEVTGEYEPPIATIYDVDSKVAYNDLPIIGHGRAS